MKTVFYTFILLFMSAFAYAQGAINYVSFFPAANVIQSEVILEQNENSFTPYAEENKGVNDNNVYNAKSGGLILGANKISTTTINNISVRVNEGRTYTVEHFDVDNIIKVSALGKIKDINIGQSCGNNDTSCDDVFISASSLYLPLSTNYHTGTQQFDVRVANLLTTDHEFYSFEFSKTFIPLQDINSEGLSWQKIRIKGTEECRWYLVKNHTGTGNYCSEP